MQRFGFRNTPPPHPLRCRQGQVEAAERGPDVSWICLSRPLHPPRHNLRIPNGILLRVTLLCAQVTVLPSAQEEQLPPESPLFLPSFLLSQSCNFHILKSGRSRMQSTRALIFSTAPSVYFRNYFCISCIQQELFHSECVTALNTFQVATFQVKMLVNGYRIQFWNFVQRYVPVGTTEILKVCQSHQISLDI